MSGLSQTQHLELHKCVSESKVSIHILHKKLSDEVAEIYTSRSQLEIGGGGVGWRAGTMAQCLNG